MPGRHRISFPAADAKELGQDEAFFYLVEGDRRVKIRLHDYDQIYLRPGLYEQLFYDRLKCSSPRKVGEILKRTLDANDRQMSELRVLDLGAGNGMMGEVMKSYGVARLIGTDIIPEARDAAFRDRPGTYDDYYVADFTAIKPELETDLREWSFDCLTSVAALGFGDIPLRAFVQALNLIKVGGWVAFNIKETFLDASDTTGFSTFVRDLIFSAYLDVFHLEKYRHRLSMEGLPLSYFAMVAQKSAEVPEALVSSHEGQVTPRERA